MNKEQEEKILKWAGYYQKEVEHFPDFDEGDEEPPSYMIKEWFNSKDEFVSLRSLPNMDNLIFLMEIVDLKVKDFRLCHIDFWKLKNSNQWHFDIENDGLLITDGKGESQVEAIQQALLKLAEK